MKQYTIKIQSLVDVITNSSSSVFCAIESSDRETITIIEKYLNSFLPYNIYSVDYDDKNMHNITFWIENGDNETISEQMYAIIKQLLVEHFPNEDFTVNNGDNYN